MTHRSTIGRSVLGSITAVVMLLCPPAQAQRRGPDPEAAARDKEARDHYNKGIRHYDLGEIDESIAEFRKAYELAAAPGLLFNIAQAYRLKKDYEKALQFYHTYLRLQPRAINRRDVEARVIEMEQLLKEQQRVGNERPHGVLPSGSDKYPDGLERRPEEGSVDSNKPSAPIDAATPSSSGNAPSTAVGATSAVARPKLLSTKQGATAVALAVIGATALVTTAALGGTALASRGTYDRGCDAGHCDSSLFDRAHGLAIGADVALGIGVAAAVVSAVLFAVHPKHPARQYSRGLAVTF